MTHKLRWSVLAGLMALLSASAVACGSNDDGDEKKPTSLCDGVTCGTNETCDPDDGQCKCGDSSNAVVCGNGERCELDPSPTCISTLCDIPNCDRGMSCDPTDGLCKCGNSGATCADGEVCVDGACQTGGGNECNGGDCLCGEGENGSLCSFGQTCENGTCKDDPCAGVNCAAGTECNPNDGICHCGGANGTICAHGQACVDDGTGNFACNGPDVCAGNTCTGGTVCDPTGFDASGKPIAVCRCGGIGTAPICGADQTCDVATGRCLGGDQCAGVECTGGTSCDPEDGACKCGGFGGTVCGASEVCAAIDGAAACSKSCNPLVQTSCGSETLGCYFDVSQPSTGAFCAPTAANAPGNGSTCDSATACAAGYHCVASGDANRCRAYCDPARGAADCGNANDWTCHTDPSMGLPAGVGICRALGT